MRGFVVLLTATYLSMANQLQYETSPYLLQHAHNPVHWYPWGEEALNLAKQENKPILVSIGYAACHWCHVMERESFEDEATAAFMNAHFINIKIDREERPDLDHIYMDAVQSMTGSGGWPLNVFLTTDQQPFYGGTYFPPKRMHNRPSWMEILQGIHKNYVENKETILQQAEGLTKHLLKSNAFGMNLSSEKDATALFNAAQLQTITQNILLQADTIDGGFGNAPKFPQTFSIIYLLRNYHFFKEEASLHQALLSLNKMIWGGIYDQLGGGFARYSTDKQWQVPHFEKMLYDNALLIMAISEAYQLTNNEHYKSTIQQTMQFIQREMTHTNNGFFSAIDADSEGVEGKFYTWTKAELDELLGDDAALFGAYYQVAAAGNWHEGTLENPPTNILWATHYPEPEEKGMIERCLGKLMEARNKRIRPQLDDKILLGWNALMITACCKAYAAIGEEAYLDMAIRNMEFLENHLQDHSTGNWNHTFKNGQAKIPAFLDDYAYLIQSYIHLQEVTGNGAYLLKAKALTKLVIQQFSEKETGFFYFTPEFQTDILIRKKEVYDGATPSGNAVMCYNLQYLSVVFDAPEWKNLAAQLIQSLQQAIIKHPTSFGVWASVLQQIVIGTREIVITGAQVNSYISKINNAYLPNKVMQTAVTSADIAAFPMLSNKSFEVEPVLFYLCENYACKKPLTSFEAFLAIV